MPTSGSTGVGFGVGATVVVTGAEVVGCAVVVFGGGVVVVGGGVVVVDGAVVVVVGMFVDDDDVEAVVVISGQLVVVEGAIVVDSAGIGMSVVVKEATFCAKIVKHTTPIKIRNDVEFWFLFCC